MSNSRKLAFWGSVLPLLLTISSFFSKVFISDYVGELILKAASVVLVVCIIAFIIHCGSDQMLSGQQKVLWILSFIFFGIFTLPIYYFVHIR